MRTRSTVFDHTTVCLQIPLERMSCDASINLQDGASKHAISRAESSMKRSTEYRGIGFYMTTMILIYVKPTGSKRFTSVNLRVLLHFTKSLVIWISLLARMLTADSYKYVLCMDIAHFRCSLNLKFLFCFAKNVSDQNEPRSSVLLAIECIHISSALEHIREVRKRLQDP